MRVARSVVLGVLAWVLVVAVGSTLVWAVISRAGQEVGATGQSVVTAGGPRTSGARSTGTGPDRPSDPGSLTTRPSTRPSSGPGTPTNPSDPTTPVSPSAPGATPPTSGPSAPAAPAAPAVQRRTWSGPGGVVVAQCRSAAMSLSSAQPDPGYAVNVAERGPERLEVELAGREDEAGRHTHVLAECVGGVPRFQVTTEGGGGGGDD